jgi:hypothetical protein
LSLEVQVLAASRVGFSGCVPGRHHEFAITRMSEKGLPDVLPRLKLAAVIRPSEQ